jgi:glycogen(starch) synthase
MRVVVVPNSYLPQLGGLEIAVSNIARELTSRGHLVTIVTSSPSWTFSRTLEDGVDVYRVPFSLPRLVFRAGFRTLLRSVANSFLSPVVAPASFIALLRIINDKKPHVVNMHYIGGNAFFVLLASRLLHFRLVVNLHGNDIEHHGARSLPARWLTKATLRRADMVLANSKHILAQAEGILADLEANSAVVGNGVHLEEFDASATFKHARPYILSIGNFGHKKGFDILIRAFVQVRGKYPGVDLVMAGDGPERDACRQLANQLGVDDGVLFLGMVSHSDVPRLLTGCELFVLPSRLEPFGIVLLEAMAARKPIVATRVGGVPEIITSMVDGLLVEPESPEALAEGIAVLLADPRLGSQLGREAYETVRRDFTWAMVCDRFEWAFCTVSGTFSQREGIA